MTLPLFPHRTPIQVALAAVRADLIHDGGPQISTMRNHRFAIVPYDPREEYALRGEIQKLSNDLVANGWVVISISLQRLLLERVRAQGEEWIRTIIETEEDLSGYDLDRGVNFLKEELEPLVEGTEGLAADCARIIRERVELHPDRKERTVAIIGRAGALFPFFRTSALLGHLDGHTGNVPVILLYPGERRGLRALSFMGVMECASEYRPRIYP